MTKLQKRSKMQARNVMKRLYESNIIKIHTRGALDRFIEIEKFPETKKLTGFYKRTVYKNQQYDSIREWLINQGFIVPFFDGYRYHYQIVRREIF
jgi:hypothetical protein